MTQQATARRTDSTARILSSRTDPNGYCRLCGSHRELSISDWRNSTRPKCKRCGGALVPSQRARRAYPELRQLLDSAPAANARRCPRCYARLRLGNIGKLCAPCHAVFVRHYPDHATCTRSQLARRVVVFCLKVPYHGGH